MTKVLTLFLIGILSFNSSVFAQVTSEYEEEPSIIANLLVAEGIALGMSAWAASERNNDSKYAASYFAFGGVFTLASPAIFGTRSAPPSVAIPLGIGWLYLSYYNFELSDGDSRDQLFMKNFLGFQLMGAASILSGIIFKDSENDQTPLSVVFLPDSVSMQYIF